MGKRSSRHIAFSLLLIGLLLVGLLPVAGIAQNDSEKEVIVSFDTPVTELIVPLGTKIVDIPLPETLAATLEGGAVADIPVTWETDGYDPDLAGTYLFTADIGTWVYAQARPVAVVTVVPPGRNINGMLWLDKNGDGIKDVGETGIAGYPVTLYAEDNLTDAVQDTLTKTDGTYLFEGMEPGSYVVKVESETIGGTEYLLPWTIANDNKFEMDEEAVGSWSVPLEIAEDTAVSGIDAGMRLPEGIKPLIEGWIPSDDPKPFETLEDMISWGFDTIVIEEGITNIDFESPITINKSLTIRAESPVTFTSSTGRHFYISSGKNVTLTFDGVTLDGDGTGGGIEMMIKKGSLELIGANITNCRAVDGGGVKVDITNINDETANVDTKILLSDCNIYGNIATYSSYNVGGGGGVYVDGATKIVLSNCNIYENRAKKSGGGVLAQSTPLEIKNCKIFDNSTNDGDGWGGGGVLVNGSSYTILNSDIYNNGSASQGGGLVSAAKGTIVNCNIYGNKAPNGGGIYALTATASGITIAVQESKVTHNEATNNGGGIYVNDIENLFIDSDVMFSGNVASIAAKSLLNIKEKYKDKIKTTDCSIYDYPLNNYDINVPVVVPVYYVDESGNLIDPIGDKLPVGYVAETDSGFTFPHDEIPSIPDYEYVGWRQGANGTLLKTTPTLPVVTSSSSIYLVYARINVTVSSVVSGDYADKTRDFTFTIKFEDASGSPLTGELAYTGGILPGSGASVPGDSRLILDPSGEANFTLRHGQVITIVGVPANGKVWIEMESVIGYTTTWQDGAESSVPGNSTDELAMSGIDRTIAFTNTYDDVVPAGIRTDDTGALLLAGVSILLLAVSLIRRRGQKGVMN